MKITVTNLSLMKRSIPTPANTAIPIGSQATVTFSYPAGYEPFFKSLENYQFKVEFSSEKTTLADAKLTDEVYVSGDNDDRTIKSDNATRHEVDTDTDNTINQADVQSEAVHAEVDVKEAVNDSESISDSSTASDNAVNEEELFNKVRQLNADQLKKMCDILGIMTNATKESTLYNKIDNSSATVEDILAAYQKVI